MSSQSVAKSGPDPLRTYHKTKDPQSERINTMSLNNCRTYCVAMSGITAGILGFQAWTGLIFYIVTSLLFSALLVVRIGFHAEKYFSNGKMVLLDTNPNNLLAYVFYWSFLYGCVHVF
eukprot:Clim_evm92s152 gene=Clim_evmTU92s152